MKCRVCRGPAIIDVRRHNANFCSEHFLKLCRDQTAKAITQFDMLQPDDRVLVAVSVGKDSLAESDKLILEVAKIIKDDYLAQNGFSSHDKTCPFYKMYWMMKNIIAFYKLAQKAIENSTAESKITWHKIKQFMTAATGPYDTIYKLIRMKFLLPTDGEAKLTAEYSELFDGIEKAFRELAEA